MLAFMGMDLETWRTANGLTLEELGSKLGCSTSQARRYCQGETALRDEALERAVEITQGALDLYAQHLVRLSWLRRNGGGGTPFGEAEIQGAA